MEAVPAGEFGTEAWDAFVGGADGAWFYHRHEWIEYQLARRRDLGGRSLAFAVLRDGRPVAAVPVGIEEDGRDGGSVRIGVEGEPCWSPAISTALTDGERDDVLRFVMDETDRLAAVHRAVSSRWRVSAIARGYEEYLPSFLAATTRSGYTDVSLCTRVVDLRGGEEAVRRGMSKGHRAAVTRARRQFTTEVESGSSPSFDAYVTLHRAIAGARARPVETYELMRQWLQEGRGALVVACEEGIPIGFVYLMIDGAASYYASTAVHDDHRGDPVGHLMLADAMAWLGRMGVVRFEVGLQQFPGVPFDRPDAKELGITRFKQGFGGRLLPWVVREKYYDPTAWRQVTEHRLDDLDDGWIGPSDVASTDASGPA